MLNIPAWYGRATASPARISGVAPTAVSDSGPNTADRYPSWIAVPIDACWNNADTVCGLNTDPSNSATYVPEATLQALPSTLPAGACSTAGLVNAASSPPTTIADSSASTVTVKAFPSRSDSLNILPNVRERLSGVFSSAAVGGDAGGVLTSPPDWQAPVPVWRYQRPVPCRRPVLCRRRRPSAGRVRRSARWG